MAKFSALRLLYCLLGGCSAVWKKLSCILLTLSRVGLNSSRARRLRWVSGIFLLVFTDVSWQKHTPPLRAILIRNTMIWFRADLTNSLSRTNENQFRMYGKHFWFSPQIANPQILGLLRYRKSANIFGVPVFNCKSAIYMINPKIAYPQISTKYCTILSKNSLRGSLFLILLCTNFNFRNIQYL
jgi:hypothetical protein